MKEYNATLIDYGEGKGKLVVESKFGKVTFAVKADSHMWVELERPHGEWIDLSDGWQEGTYECSNCKTEFVLIEGTPEDNEYNFCPNCGADMREEGGENGI